MEPDIQRQDLSCVPATAFDAILDHSQPAFVNRNNFEATSIAPVELSFRHRITKTALRAARKLQLPRLTSRLGVEVNVGRPWLIIQTPVEIYENDGIVAHIPLRHCLNPSYLENRTFYTPDAVPARSYSASRLETELHQCLGRWIDTQTSSLGSGLARQEFPEEYEMLWRININGRLAAQGLSHESPITLREDFYRVFRSASPSRYPSDIVPEFEVVFQQLWKLADFTDFAFEKCSQLFTPPRLINVQIQTIHYKRIIVPKTRSLARVVKIFSQFHRRAPH